MAVRAPLSLSNHLLRVLMRNVERVGHHESPKFNETNGQRMSGFWLTLLR